MLCVDEWMERRDRERNEKTGFSAAQLFFLFAVCFRLSRRLTVCLIATISRVERVWRSLEMSPWELTRVFLSRSCFSCFLSSNLYHIEHSVENVKLIERYTKLAVESLKFIFSPIFLPAVKSKQNKDDPTNPKASSRFQGNSRRQRSIQGDPIEWF